MSALEKSRSLDTKGNRPVDRTGHGPKVELPARTAKVLSITSAIALVLFVSPLVLAMFGLFFGLS